MSVQNILSYLSYPHIVNYYEIIADTYEDIAKRRSDGWTHVGHVDFVELKLVQQTRRDYNQNYDTPRGDIDKVLGSKTSTKCEDEIDKLQNGSRLLFEGRPGTGKTTLMEKIACDLSNEHKNKSHSDENRKFVILVKLRELDTEINPEECDLLCTAYPRLTDEETQAFSSKFARDSGENIILILDGFDEYDPGQEENNFIRQIIEGIVFPQSIVIVSSRPTATHNIRRNEGIQVIEVVGFNTKKVLQYIDTALEGDEQRDDRDKLKKHLDDNPKVMNMCYIPLYCAMLVQLYKDEPDESRLPRTKSEFYEHFTLSIFNRYTFGPRNTKKLPDQQKQQVLSFHELKGEDDFRRICEFAYNTTNKSNQVFTETEILDLLVSKSIFVPVGGAVRKSYSFVHLTFQEYLTAIHIAWYCDKTKRTEIVTDHCSSSAFHVVWQFFFGILKPFSNDLFEQVRKASPNDHLLHVKCAYESQHPEACTEVLGYHDSRLKLSHIRPSDLPCLTYVLKNAENDRAIVCKLEFSNCNFSENDALRFLKEVGDYQLSLGIL